MSSASNVPETGPDTIVLVHGFWVTPRSWENWIARYEHRGYRVIAPAYPRLRGRGGGAERRPLADRGRHRPAIIEHLESVVRELPSPPILMGHSAGGAFVQILLDHGYGAAGVAINSAPPEGVPVVPLSQVKATFPVLRNPANRHKTVGYTHEQWHYAFTNTFSEDESRALYERYHIPASGRILFESALANLQPGHQGTWVDYTNDDRAPLLFVAGTEDHLMPAKIQWSNARHYRSATRTEVVEFGGKAHLLPAQEGWEQIADYVLAWAVRHARVGVAENAPAAG